nr:hypothetical protein [Tanacetum cinerariifolium]
MSQPPIEPGYFTHLLNSNPQQYSSSLNQSNPSTPGSQNSNSSSQSYPSLGTQMSPDQCDAAERAYEAKREKELAMMQCRELEFLMLDLSLLSPAKRAIEKKQAEIMRKYPDA